MKRFLCLLTILALCGAMFAGCSSESAEETAENTTVTESATQQTTESATAESTTAGTTAAPETTTQKKKEETTTKKSGSSSGSSSSSSSGNKKPSSGSSGSSSGSSSSGSSSSKPSTTKPSTFAMSASEIKSYALDQISKIDGTIYTPEFTKSNSGWDTPLVIYTDDSASEIKAGCNSYASGVYNGTTHNGYNVYVEQTTDSWTGEKCLKVYFLYGKRYTGPSEL